MRLPPSPAYLREGRGGGRRTHEEWRGGEKKGILIPPPPPTSVSSTHPPVFLLLLCGTQHIRTRLEGKKRDERSINRGRSTPPPTLFLLHREKRGGDTLPPGNCKRDNNAKYKTAMYDGHAQGNHNRWIGRYGGGELTLFFPFPFHCWRTSSDGFGRPKARGQAKSAQPGPARARFFESLF